jgi:hypothetical protein
MFNDSFTNISVVCGGRNATMKCKSISKYNGKRWEKDAKSIPLTQQCMTAYFLDLLWVEWIY